MSESYSILKVDRYREKWLWFAKRRYCFLTMEEIEEVFQDCLLHCWIMEINSFSEWRSEYKKLLYQCANVKRGFRDRLFIELDAPIKDDEEGCALVDILPDKSLPVELQVICRQEALQYGNRFWDEYEQLNKIHFKEPITKKSKFDVGKYNLKERR